MKINYITYQNRRDFTAVYICEYCGETDIKGRGYDDANFHQNVIPKMKCKSCGQAADMANYRPMTTKYPEGFQV